MPSTKEFTITMEDRPGTFGKLCRTLADRQINIVAFQSLPHEGKSLVRLITDNPSTAKSVLESQRATFSENDVAQISLPHQPGELARAASKLGDAGININYAYSGIESRTNAPLLFFGVSDVARAVTVLEQAASAAKA